MYKSVRTVSWREYDAKEAASQSATTEMHKRLNIGLVLVYASIPVIWVETNLYPKLLLKTVPSSSRYLDLRVYAIPTQMSLVVSNYNEISYDNIRERQLLPPMANF